MVSDGPCGQRVGGYGGVYEKGHLVTLSFKYGAIAMTAPPEEFNPPTWGVKEAKRWQDIFYFVELLGAPSHVLLMLTGHGEYAMM
jgi:hypothetical protein